MIKVETVLTATPVVLEKIPDSRSLYDEMGKVIQGLDDICRAANVYTHDNIATRLPDSTHNDSQHELIMATVTTKISAAIRQSLEAVKTYIVPSCDKIEQAIKDVGGSHTTEDLMFAKLYIDFIHVGDDFFTSPVFPDAPDEKYGNDVLFSTDNIVNLGVWPKLDYASILDIIPEANDYPELVGALSDSNAVEQAWAALGQHSFWLGTTGKELNAKNVSVTTELKSLIVLTLLVNKFASLEDPFNGVTEISLDDYRRKIESTKRFLNTVLYFTRRRLAVAMASGVAVVKSDLKYDKCTEEQSQFFGTDVLNGGCQVIYGDVVAEFFANSQNYSLSEAIVGMLVSEAKGTISKSTGFLTNTPYYTGVAKTYIKDLSMAVTNNITVSTKKAITRAINELANSPLWAEMLSEEGKYKNLAYRLEDLIKEKGGIIEPLLVPSINKRIRCGELCVANTIVSVVFAEVLGLPIAASILRNNISSEHLSVMQQRKRLAKAITRYVVESFIKK